MSYSSDAALTVRCPLHDAALGQVCLSEDGAVIGICPARRAALADLEREADRCWLQPKVIPNMANDIPQTPDPDHAPDTPDDSQIHDSVSEAPAWHALPPAQRAAYVVRECREGRWLPLMRKPLDDDVLDLMAAVEAAQQDNTAALATILRNGNTGKMLVTAVKILGEVLEDQGLGIDYTRVWASYAVERSYPA